MRISLAKITTYVVTGIAVIALLGAMGGTWSTSQPAIAAPVTTPRASSPEDAAPTESSPPAPSPSPSPSLSSSSPSQSPSSPSSPSSSSSSPSSSPSPSPSSPPSPTGGSATAPPAPTPTNARTAGGKRELAGKLNINTATAEQLLLLPTVGPAKAERIIVWRQKNGGFKRTADLRRVKGFGYKTFKRLEPFLAITGDSTLAYH
ncbi:MAG: helix-hairpin-helix domain-containing protein [Deltaproteobacteria bacterium]|nr:helix-hairpin-helix domain-containing protein [Deltaproteobacteria bacterium]